MSICCFGVIANSKILGLQRKRSNVSVKNEALFNTGMDNI